MSIISAIRTLFRSSKTGKATNKVDINDSKKATNNGKKPEPNQENILNKINKVKERAVNAGAGVGAGAGWVFDKLKDIGKETIQPTVANTFRRNNLNVDPHTINTYSGTGTRSFDWLFPIIPPNANKAQEYTFGILTLKSLIAGLQMSESRSNLLVCQDYVFTIEFGSKNPTITSNVKNYLGRLLQIKELTEFNITSITTDFLGISGAESTIRQDGMPLGYSIRLNFQERRPLRMEDDSQSAADSDKPQDGKEQISSTDIDNKNKME